MAKATKKPEKNAPGVPGDEASLPGSAPLDLENVNPPAESVKTQTSNQPEEEFMAVTLHFPHGFYCPPLQKSYKPGYCKVMTERELNFVRKHADNLK